MTLGAELEKQGSRARFPSLDMTCSSSFILYFLMTLGSSTSPFWLVW